MVLIKFLKIISLDSLAPVTALVLLVSSTAMADFGDSLVLCKNNKSVRTLRVEIGADQKCKSIYTKQGVDETIGSSQSSNACSEFVAKVRKNLELGNWNCREVKAARASMLNPGELE